MRRAERALAPDFPAAELARDRCDHRHFERLGGLQRRQDAGQACREQRFARSGRAAHQQVMSARCRDLERALGDFLSLDLGEVGPADRQARPRRTAAAATSAVPLRWASKASRSGAAMTSSSPAQAASLPCAAGQISPLSEEDAWIAARSTPGDAAIRPSRHSSPTAT